MSTAPSSPSSVRRLLARPLSRRMVVLCGFGLLLVIILFLLTLVPAWSILRGLVLGEPFYQYRPAGYWADRIDLEERSKMAAPPATGFAGWWASVRSRYQRLDPIELRDFRNGAIWDREAQPVLLWMLRDPRATVRLDAAHMFAGHQKPDPAMIPAMIELLRDGDPAINEVAAYGLRRMPDRVRPEVPKLLAILDELSVNATLEVLRLIHTMDPENPHLPDAVQGLFARATANDLRALNVRLSCLNLLEALGSRARSASPLLLRVVRGDNVRLAMSAIPALRAIEPERLSEEDVLATWVRALETTQAGWEIDQLKREVLQDLRKLGAEGRPAVAALVQLLDNTLLADDALITLKAIDVETFSREAGRLLGTPKPHLRSARWTCLDLLGTLGPSARSATPQLLLVLREDDVFLAEKALTTLRAIDPERLPKEEMLATWVRVLESAEPGTETEQLKRAVLQDLHDLGPEARSVVPILVRLLDSPFLVHDALVALEAIHVETFSRETIRLLEHTNPSQRAVAVGLFPSVPQRPAEALERVLSLLNDDHIFVRLNAAASVAELGEEAKAARPILRKWLAWPDAAERVAGARALAATDPQDQEGIQVLVAMLKANPAEPIGDQLLPFSRVRLDAARALGALGPRATSAVPALLEACRDQSEELAQAAAAALRSIDPVAARKAGIE